MSFIPHAVELNRVLEKTIPKLTARCCLCEFEASIVPKNSMGDGYCRESDTTLTGYFNNGKAGQQPRKCWRFVQRRDLNPRPHSSQLTNQPQPTSVGSVEQEPAGTVENRLTAPSKAQSQPESATEEQAGTGKSG